MLSLFYPFTIAKKKKILASGVDGWMDGFEGMNHHEHFHGLLIVEFIHPKFWHIFPQGMLRNLCADVVVRTASTSIRLLEKD